MTKSALPYILFIRESLAQIAEYKPATLEDLQSSQVSQDAILMRLQVVGENLSKIRNLDEDAFEERAPKSWHEVIGLRNVISHGYETIKLDRIWSFLGSDFTELSSEIENVDMKTGLPPAKS